MNHDVYEAGFVSMTILKLYEEVAKITGANPPPDLRSIEIAIVLARALESIVQRHPRWETIQEFQKTHQTRACPSATSAVSDPASRRLSACSRPRANGLNVLWSVQSAS
jgi:hypothetical protein